MTPVRVLSVASEIYPIIKTGGLADVAGALPVALKAEGIETRTLVPGYPTVLDALGTAAEVHRYPHFFGGDTRLLSGSHGELDLFVLDAPHLFAAQDNRQLFLVGRTHEAKCWPIPLKRPFVEKFDPA